MEINIDELTPMMQKYMETKQEYKDCILFYRLGDFYEMFFEDALTASRELEITLTGKSCGLKERAPMCGVPFHAVEGYLNKLVSKGYKVAICEQVEDPKQAKGLVKREVTRIVTPGTNLDTYALDETKNNYIMCVVYVDNKYGVSVADVTTGAYYVTELDSERKLLDEISKYMPSEIISNEAFFVSGIDLEDLRHRLGITIYALDAWYFGDELAVTTLQEHFHVASLDGLGLADYNCGVIAAGALLKYLYETQKTTLDHMTAIEPYSTGKFMVLDSSTRRNLELVETLREKQKRGSLLWVLDKTKTAMGARLLRAYLEQPLIDKKQIEARLDAVEELRNQAIAREEIREYFEANKARFAKGASVHAKHILVDSEDKCNKLLESIVSGGKAFEDVAKESSTCPSGANGGDLGEFGKGQMVKEFEDAAFAAEIGHVVGPVKTQFGYHLIKVEDKKEAEDAKLDDVKEQIKSEIMQKKQQEAYTAKVEELKKKYME